LLVGLKDLESSTQRSPISRGVGQGHVTYAGTGLVGDRDLDSHLAVVDDLRHGYIDPWAEVALDYAGEHIAGDSDRELVTRIASLRSHPLGNGFRHGATTSLLRRLTRIRAPKICN